MDWKIIEKESRTILLLKLLYLIPMQVIMYLPLVIYVGIKEHPPSDIISTIKDAWKKAKKSK